MVSEPFVSPLALSNQDALTRIDFGVPAPDAEVDALGWRLAGRIGELITALPEPLRAEAAAVLTGYHGSRAHFVSLFYRPAWSFLRWLPSAGPQVAEAAERAHALALFLHLWDDHLSDRQLDPDLIRLQLRGLAWERFSSAAQYLCAVSGVPRSQVDLLVDAYLVSTHRSGEVATLDEHAERMVQQVGIWRVVPRLYGQIVGGTADADALSLIVERFSVAWRLVDDVQDAAVDVRSGQPNAVFYAMAAAGRAEWMDCGRRSRLQGQLDGESWLQLRRDHAAAALAVVITVANANLAAARQAADARGWFGLGEELENCRVQADPAQTVDPLSR